MRYHFLNPQIRKTSKAWQTYGKAMANKHSHILHMGMQNSSLLPGENLLGVWQYLIHMNLWFDYDINPCFCNLICKYSSKTLKLALYRLPDLQITHMALFAIVKYWEQSKCRYIGDWMYKVRYIHTVEYYAAVKGGDFMNLLIVKVH